MNRLQTAIASGLLALAVTLSGCASMRVISSTPPVKEIVLDQPSEFSFGLASKISMPAGEYKPVLEDNAGYYYQAPSKLAARDIFSYVADGGLFIKRGEEFPSKWYALDDLGGGNGSFVKTGSLPKDFLARVIK
ncbi:MAG TPA: hypothetical protein VHY30_05020 [Verrucomicrobiae bacterium]|jgi:hypothetical protein|nr:hypothetical protein [Verrucomicrobiae bacterium]